jgi:sigma-B regulation protein RsbU (phosphoserine phosphatase)
VGGDYYDFFKTCDGRYAIGVFDISGHGVSAALVMAYLKAQFMQVMDRFDSPRDIVGWVNTHSFDFLKSVKKYATVNFVVFREDTLTYSCGGGFGTLLSKGKVNRFNKRDHFIGLRDKPFREYELPFSPGDVLLLYTDGVVEAQNRKGEDYSVSRLTALVQKNIGKPVNDILDLCMEDYRKFRKEDSDDKTMLIMRKKS